MAETNKLSKRLGNEEAKKYADTNHLGELQARRVAISVIHDIFRELKAFTILPDHASVLPFRKGWRGVYTINHGTAAGYSQGCREKCCKDAWRVYQAARREENRRMMLENTLERKKEAFAGLAVVVANEQHMAEVQIAVDKWVKGIEAYPPPSQPPCPQCVRTRLRVAAALGLQ